MEGSAHQEEDRACHTYHSQVQGVEEVLSTHGKNPVVVGVHIGLVHSHLEEAEGARRRIYRVREQEEAAAHAGHSRRNHGPLQEEGRDSHDNPWVQATAAGDSHEGEAAGSHNGHHERVGNEEVDSRP